MKIKHLCIAACLAVGVAHADEAEQEYNRQMEQAQRTLQESKDRTDAYWDRHFDKQRQDERADQMEYLIRENTESNYRRRR